MQYESRGARYSRLLHHSKASDLMLGQEFGNKSKSNKLMHISSRTGYEVPEGSRRIALLFLQSRR